MQMIRSIIFLIYTYGGMAIIGILCAIPALRSKDAAYKAMKFYCRYVFWGAKHLVGITFEVRGDVPTDHVVVASKHQSFLDVMIHAYYLPRFTFVMKEELKWAPFLGFYAMRIGVAPVKRGKGGKSVEQMMSGISKNTEFNQLVIYPQGTRVPPGVKKPYKIGAGVIAQRTGRPVVLAATNVGLFWPKKGIMKYPGHAVVQYYERAPEGLEPEPFMNHLEKRIEEETAKLLKEAGFKG